MLKDLKKKYIFIKDSHKKRKGVLDFCLKKRLHPEQAH